MDQRREFVQLATQEQANVRELCRRFGVHPNTAYKWLGRWTSGEELADRSRRPHSSPGRTEASIEERILGVRDAHPAWGARKIVRCLERDGVACPAPSTVHAILQRHGRITASLGGATAHLRFEMPEPNQLWQMDFKGHMPLSGGGRCHPLTVVDDHSRYNLCLAACADEQRGTVQNRLDNGKPWGDPSGQIWTRLGVWLLKLGVSVIHSRPTIRRAAARTSAFTAH
jgi:transposase InsO family protein